MVATPGTPQVTFASGEIAPQMRDRKDLRQYYAGASLFERVESVPQGGFRLAPGSRHVDRVRNPLQAVSTTGPHAATSSVATTIATIDLVTARPVAAVQLVMSATAAIGNAILVEAQDTGTGTWIAVGAAFDIGTAARTRLAARPPRQPVTARFVRVRLAVAPSGSQTITLASVIVSVEGSSATTVRALRAFSYSATETYDLVFTSSHVDVYRNDVFVAAIASSLPAAVIGRMWTWQRRDVLFVTDDTIAPVEIRRGDADHEWSMASVVWVGIPEVNYGGAYTNVAEQWDLTISGNTGNAGQVLIVSVDGNETTTISLPPLDSLTPGFATLWATFRAALAAALEALPNVEPGVIVTQTHSQNGIVTSRIEFAGAQNEGENYTLSARIPNNNVIFANVYRARLGKKGGEAIMSVSRGWPAAGAFYQDRLFLAGFASKGEALLASQPGEYFTLDTTIAAANGPLLVGMDTDGAERVLALARGRHLVIFTDQGEYYIQDREVKRSPAPNVVNSSRNGVSQGLPILEDNDALIYVSGAGNSVYAATFSDVSQAYESTSVSLLAPHLVAGIASIALQKPGSASDAARLYLVRDDGLMVSAAMIRGQDVNAFARWPTDGLVRAVAVDGANRVRLLVERTVGAATELHLETLDDTVLLDGQVSRTAPSGTVTGLAMHEGRAVWAVADGYVQGAYTVSGGQIALGQAATVVAIGRWRAPRVRTLPRPKVVGDNVVVDKPQRVHGVRANLIATTSIAVGANDRPPRDVTLYRAGMPVDQPLAPVTGPIAVQGLDGFSMDGIVEFTQVRPGRLQVASIVVEGR